VIGTLTVDDISKIFLCIKMNNFKIFDPYSNNINTLIILVKKQNQNLVLKEVTASTIIVCLASR